MAKDSQPHFKAHLMNPKKTVRPPRFATWLLSLYCRPGLLEDLQGDLTEFFARNVQTRGVFLARLIYVIDVVKFIRPYTVRKFTLTNPFTKKVMLASYFKTSGRVMMRNKLFSGINIFGLAFSLSVSLLVVGLVTDLFSYDGTLQNRDRLFRVVSNVKRAGQDPFMMATTSWKAGKLIQQGIPGIQSIALLRRGFSGDAKIDDNALPVTGLYANEGFFDVFSFPLTEGNAATALRRPYSLVLTQTTAIKLFGRADPIGKVVKFDTINYTVTGVLQDLPKLSTIRFEMLVSLATIDENSPATDGDGNFMDWTSVYSNYAYVLLAKKSQPGSISTALDKMSQRENASLKDKVELSLQPLRKISIGTPLGNEIFSVMPIRAVLFLCALAFVILLSACFNYTNLSLARALRRSREVGIRKVVGAKRIQVLAQFISESVLISLLSLGLAFVIFLALRNPFLSLHEALSETFSLELSTRLILYFISLSIGVGLIAGLLPALFYSKIDAVQVLKDAASVKVFRHINLRKALIVIQYCFSLIFITATILINSQYKSMMSTDLGFTAANVLNIDMQGNKVDIFKAKLAEIPAVKEVSRSLIISSLGSIYGSKVKYKNPLDSEDIDLNCIDEKYIPLHHYTLLAGRNFNWRPSDSAETETIVNEQLLRRFDIGHNNAQNAIGEVITMKDQRLTIIGVVKDFHYTTLDRPIEPAAFRYLSGPGGYLNVKVTSDHLPATMAAIQAAWKESDKVHPFKAQFYVEAIQQEYSGFTVMTKIIGFLAFLAIGISSLGLFGMVVYSMEKRVKEISIRKVLGAGDGSLMYLLSKGFLLLLLISAAIALPVTWLLFDRIVWTNFAYHEPVEFRDLFTGLFVVASVALFMIGTQTFRIVRSRPAKALKNE